MTQKIRHYAGIGSRETPAEVLEKMVSIARALREMGFVLRSGGARGADSAFQSGAGDLAEIYTADDATSDAIDLAKKHHPAWNICSDYAKKLHARNGQILLGKDLSVPVEFVICWTPGGRTIGGTGQAIRVAKSLEIEIFNLAVEGELQRLRGFYKELRGSH